MTAYSPSSYRWNRFNPENAPQVGFEALVVVQFGVSRVALRAVRSNGGWTSESGYFGDDRGIVLAFTNAPKVPQAGPIPDCHCKPGQCGAPPIGGKRYCLNPEKAGFK